MKTCEQCGNPFDPGRKTDRRFCSRACANARGLANPKRGIQPKVCNYCGRVFKPHHRSYRALFCSRPCAGKAKAKPRPEFTCQHCGHQFSPTYVDRSQGGEKKRYHHQPRKFCSVACNARWYAKQRLALHDGPPPWKELHRQYSRDFKLVQKAVARGEIELPDNWNLHDPCVQQWVQLRRREIEAEEEAACSYATRSGWPADLGPRRIQVLNLLAHLGVPVGAKELIGVLRLNLQVCQNYLRELHDLGWVSKSRRGRCLAYFLSPFALTTLEERSKCELSNSQPERA